MTSRSKLTAWCLLLCASAVLSGQSSTGSITGLVSDATGGVVAGVMLYAADGNLRPLEDIEADVIRLAIGHYRGRMTEVARRLGIGRSTLYRKLTELGIGEAS